MAKLWKFFGVIVAALLILGLLLAGTGWLTGASLERVQLVLSDDIAALKTAAARWQETLSGYLPFLNPAAPGGV